MPRIVRILLTGFSFAFFSVGSGVLAFVLLPLARLGAPSPSEARRRAQRLVSRGFRLFMGLLDLLGLARVQLTGSVAARPEGAFVLIANHPCLLDVITLLGQVEGTACIVKHGVARSPFVGRVAAALGYLPAPDPEADPTVTPQVLDLLVERLQQDEPVLVFPEGTRSPRWGLNRFRRGAAEAALQAEVPVWPVFITASEPTLMSGQRWWDVPERTLILTVDFGEPFFVPPETGSRKLTREVQDGYKRRIAAAKTREGLVGEEAV